MKKRLNILLVIFSMFGGISFGEINETEFNALKAKVEELIKTIKKDDNEKEIIIGKEGEFEPYSYSKKNKNNILIGYGPFIKDKDKFQNTIVMGENLKLGNDEESVNSIYNSIILGLNNNVLKAPKTTISDIFVLGHKNKLTGHSIVSIGNENKIKNLASDESFSFVLGRKNEVNNEGYVIGEQNRINSLKNYRDEGYNPNITGTALYVNGRHNIIGSSAKSTNTNFRQVGFGVITGNGNIVTESGNMVYGSMNKINGGIQTVVLGRGNIAIKGMTWDEWIEKKLPYKIEEKDLFLLYKALDITYEEFENIKSAGTELNENEFNAVMEIIKKDVNDINTNKIKQVNKAYGGMLAVGSGNTVRGDNALAVGTGSKAIENWAVAMGIDNETKSKYSTVLGNRNITEKDSVGSTVIGILNYNTGEYSINIGAFNNNLYNFEKKYFEKNESGNESIALGISNKSQGEKSLSVGYKNEAQKMNSTAIGSYSNAAGEKSVAVGYYNRSLGSYSQAIGDINLTGERATAIGYWNNALTRNSVAIGQENNVSGYAGVAFGSQNNKNTQNLIKALGIENGNTGDFSSIFGISNISIGEYTLAFGNDNFTLGRKALSIGNSAKSIGYETIAIGTNATAGPNEISKDKLLDLKRAVAIGSETSVAISDAVALGAYSVAATEKGVYGYNPLTGKVMDDASILKLNNKVEEANNLEGYRTTLEEAKEEYESKKIELENKLIEINTRKWDGKDLSEEQKKAELQKLQVEYKKIEAELVEKKGKYDEAQKKIFDTVGAWQSQLGALSIGDEATGRTRQITGVAAGTKDTDAVNVAQLKQLANLSVMFYNSDNKSKDNYTEPTLIDFNKLKLEFGDGLKAEKVGENDNEKLLITIDRASINNGSSSTTPGETPTIEINDEGYWVINGKVTDKQSKGADGKTPTIAINNEGYWVINGEVTDKQSKGADGKTPTIAINNEGYWVINGEVTDKQSKGADGKDGNSGSANIALSSDDNISITEEKSKTKIGLKKEINVESIKGLKDLNENSDGSSAANKNYVDSKFNKVKGEINKAVGGVANAIAMANLPQVDYYSGYKKQISAAYGYYGGQNAISLGLSGISKNGKFVYKISGSLNSSGNLGFGAGLGYQFDKEDVINSNDSIIKELRSKLNISDSNYKKSQEEIKELKKELESLKNIVNKLLNVNPL